MAGPLSVGGRRRGGAGGGRGLFPSPKKSDAVKSQPAGPKQSLSGELAVAARLPVAEFQQAVPRPPSEPLPKPTPEPLAWPATQPVEPSPPVAREKVPSAGGTAPVEAHGDAGAPPPTGRPKIAKNSGQPFDPIAENGPIFVIESGGRTTPWPKPKLAMIVTGMEEGYIEPCGCAGLDRMKGGMSRRHTLFQELRHKGWPVVGLDVGGLVQGFGPQAEQKFQTLVEGKRTMGYNAIALGTDDLRLPATLLASLAGKRPLSRRMWRCFAPIWAWCPPTG